MEKEITELHSLLYEYLMGIHAIDTNFMFQVRKNRRGDRSTDNGYLFNGNDDYLETSFWAGKSTLHTTPIIRLVYGFKHKTWMCELVGRSNDKAEEEKKRAYFKDMAMNLTELDFVNENEDIPIWRKELQNGNEFLSTLHEFITEDRKIIDDYVSRNYNKDIVNFINLKDFQGQLAKIDYTNFRHKKRTYFLALDYQFHNQSKFSAGLPYALGTLYIKNFQGINEIILDSTMEITTAQWVFLTGENGFGKTSILKAIALGLIGDEMGTDANPIVQTDSHLSLTGLQQNMRFLHNVLPKQSFGNDFKLATYGVVRFAATDNSKSEKSDLKTYSLFRDDSQLRDVQEALIKDYAYNKPRFEQITKTLCRIVPGIKEIRIDTSNGNPKVLYIEQDGGNHPYNIAIELDQLAAGFRSILTMIGDMVIRLSDNLTSSVEDLSGVVIIDEIDAHLHPKYQYELPKLLSEAFPKVQFIVSTHSPIPILGLPKDVKSVVLTVNRTVEDGITVERMDDDFDIRRLNPNALLTSPIFGFQELFAASVDDDDDDEQNEPLPVENFSELTRLKSIRDSLKRLKTEGKI